MNGESTNRRTDPGLVTKIIAGYVSHHSVGADQIAELIRTVHQTMARLGAPPEPETVLTPAVPVRRSVQREFVVCLDCGWKGKMLRRHLTTRHGLRSDEYLKRWNLQSDHLLTAPAYSEQRSSLAKELGLGRGSRAVETKAASAASAASAPPRGRPRGARTAPRA